MVIRVLRRDDPVLGVRESRAGDQGVGRGGDEVVEPDGEVGEGEGEAEAGLGGGGGHGYGDVGGALGGAPEGGGGAGVDGVEGVGEEGAGG